MLTRVVKLHWNLEDGGRKNRRNPGAASHAATPLIIAYLFSAHVIKLVAERHCNISNEKNIHILALISSFVSPAMAIFEISERFSPVHHAGGSAKSCALSI